MAKKPKNRVVSAIEATGGEDEKMVKIVEEVDRFFQSVHADIEDWKFSMEEDGEGTRIFVRFQIHINKPGGSPKTGVAPEKPAGPEALKELPAGRSAVGAPAERAGPETAEEVHDAIGADRRADSDLASFVDLWRSKRESNKGSEYHKEGAPYVEEGSERKGRKGGGDRASSDTSGDRTD